MKPLKNLEVVESTAKTTFFFGMIQAIAHEILESPTDHDLLRQNSDFQEADDFCQIPAIDGNLGRPILAHDDHVAGFVSGTIDGFRFKPEIDDGRFFGSVEKLFSQSFFCQKLV